MAIGIIDYSASYFKYKILTPIQEESTNKALKRLKVELQAYTSSAEIDLERDNYSYLELDLRDKEYVSISNT